MFWRKAFSETRKDTEISSVIIQDIGGCLVTIFLLFFLGVAKSDELLELILLTIGGGLSGVILFFLYRLIFITPEKLFTSKTKLDETDLKNRGFEKINIAPPITDGDRMEMATGLATGKRLTYKQVI